MEQQNKRMRNPNSAAADGGDLLQSQAQLWIDLGAAMAGLLRRMCGAHSPQPSAEDSAEGAPSDDQASRRPSSEQEAA